VTARPFAYYFSNHHHLVSKVLLRSVVLAEHHIVSPPSQPETKQKDITMNRAPYTTNTSASNAGCSLDHSRIGLPPSARLVPDNDSLLNLLARSSSPRLPADISSTLCAQFGMLTENIPATFAMGHGSCRPIGQAHLVRIIDQALELVDGELNEGEQGIMNRPGSQEPQDKLALQ
jgi:hypothetical protein